MEFEKEDQVISEVLRSVGPWSKFIVIGGGYALLIYKLYLADQKLKVPPVGTRDIDSLIPRRIPEISHKNIAKYLGEAGFAHVFKDRDLPPTESYSREIEGVEIELEFLTDNATRHDKTKNVEIAGVIAQPLSYLTLSLQKTLEFQTRSGFVGQVVSPGAWIFHKGLTFTRRKGASKRYKDLYGIWYVTTQLGLFSEQAIAEFHMLAKQHAAWFRTFQKNLNHWMEQATPAGWLQLETQDPSGRLKKLSFKDVIQKLL